MARGFARRGTGIWADAPPPRGGEKEESRAARKGSGAWPALYLVLGCYVVACFSFWGMILRQTEGHLVYPLDDAYIHMSLAKNLAQHGIWGVTRHEFSSSSSSPLWVALLATVYRFVGVNEWTPLILNLISGLLVLLTAHRLLLRRTEDFCAIATALLGLCFLAPMVLLVFTGMEHTLQILLAIVFVALASRIMEEKSFSPFSRQGVGMLLLVPAMVMIRFEGLFLAAIFSFILCCYRRWIYGVLVLFMAVLPVVVGGLISVSRGWLWLPASVLFKGRLPHASSLKNIVDALGFHSLYQIFSAPHLLSIVAALLAIYIWRGHRGAGFLDAGQILICLTVLTTLVHLQFASVGGTTTSSYLYRYEAYLVALGLLAAVFSIHGELWSRLRGGLRLRAWSAVTGAWVMIIVLLIFPLVKRGREAAISVPLACGNVYDQQYQMARFVKTFYDGSSIAANDIGAINYFSDLHIVDLCGLGTREICRRKFSQTYDTQTIEDQTRNMRTRIAIVYDNWFGVKPFFWGSGPKLPVFWKKVGQWRVTRTNVVLGDDKVSFYAVAPGEDARLKRALREFSSRLPATVAQSGEYMDDRDGQNVAIIAP